jgi:N-acetylmuramoyl-L-alanine amidase
MQIPKKDILKKDILKMQILKKEIPKKEILKKEIPNKLPSGQWRVLVYLNTDGLGELLTWV